MTDLDFDELDRAVNSLINRDESAPAKQSTPTDTSAPASPATPAPPAHTSPAQVVIPKRTAPLGAKRSFVPAAARGSRGGVIDIVAPSANRQPARTAPQIKPISDVASLSAPKAPVSAPAPVEVEAVTTPQPAPKPAWPDPLDAEELATPVSHAPAPDAAEPAPPHPEPAEPEQEITPPPLKPGQSDEVPVTPEEPLNEEKTTPFVAASKKVEKRPLGAYSDYAPAEEPSRSQPEQPPAANALTDEPVPPELSPEVLAAESNEENPKKKAETKKASAQKAETPAETMHQTAMLSIPKQYKTTEKPLDTSTHPIYDSKEYHPPLLEPQAAGKKSKRWLQIGIIIVILIILAVIGFLAYQFFIKTQ